jgi:hypothetical protein
VADTNFVRTTFPPDRLDGTAISEEMIAISVFHSRNFTSFIMEAETMAEKLKHRKDSLVRSRHWYRNRMETFSEYLDDLHLFWASEKALVMA